MRGNANYAGAMLLYGPQARPPDLTLVMQFLVDDLRFDGRKVTWIALKGNSLRLWVGGYELALACTDGALSPEAFRGVLRPATALVADGASVPPPEDIRDLARGRVLHTLRRHSCVLSVMLRPRSTASGIMAEAGSEKRNDQSFIALARECRALLEPVIEAARPATVIWQPGAVAYTCEEFLSSRGRTLVMPGDATRPLQIIARYTRPHPRPGPTALLASSEADALALLPASKNLSSLVALPPQSRAERAAHRSAGQLFGISRRPGRPVAMPRLYRQDARVSEAMRAPPDPEAIATEKARKRHKKLARAAMIMALALWFTLLLPPPVGLL